MSIIQRIKNYFNSLLKEVNREDGVAPIVAYGIYAAITAGITLWGYFALKNGIQQGTIDFLIAIIQTINSVSVNLINLSGGFLSYTLGPTFTSQTLTQDPNFVLMWANMRDLTNMLIVLAFVFIGIATTLRLKDYQAQKLLPGLILVALLINFSGLMCNTIFDISNTVQNAFLKNGGSGGVQLLATNLTKFVTDAAQAASSSDAADQNKTVAMLMASIGVLLVILFGSITFLILGILLAARYAILVVFYIVSPLAMFCYVFPFTRKFWTQWWEQFLQWSFIGVISGFLIYLAATSVPQGNVVLDPSRYFVSFIFIFLAYRLARKGSAVGSAAIIGLAGATAGYALGTVGKVAQTAGKQLSQSRAGQAIGRGATAMGERIGIGNTRLVAPGTTNLMREKQLQEHESEKRGKTWDRAQTRNIATSSALTRRARNDKVEAVKKMADDHRLGELSVDQNRAAIGYATSRGVSINSLAEKDYRASQFDTNKVNTYITNHPGISNADAERLVNTYITNHPGISNADAERAVRIEQLEANLPSMKRKQLQSIDREDLRDNYDLIRDSFTPNMVKQFRTADPGRISALKNHLGSVATATSPGIGLAHDIQQARAAGNMREVDRLTKIHDAINVLS